MTGRVDRRSRWRLGKGRIATRREYEIAGFRSPNYTGRAFDVEGDPLGEVHPRRMKAHADGFYDTPFSEHLESMDPDTRADYRNEIVRQVDLEMQKHGVALQRLGILVGFTSVILIQALVFLASESWAHPAVTAVYAIGTAILFSACLDGVLVLISRKLATPSSGAHAWDLEDLVRSGDHGSLSDVIELELYRSIDTALIANHGINNQIGLIGKWLIVGLSVIIVSLAMEFLVF